MFNNNKEDALKTYEGIIEITKIENTGDNADQIGTLKARFVRYPGCQQLFLEI